MAHEEIHRGRRGGCSIRNGSRMGAQEADCQGNADTAASSASSPLPSQPHSASVDRGEGAGGTGVCVGCSEQVGPEQGGFPGSEGACCASRGTACCGSTADRPTLT